MLLNLLVAENRVSAAFGYLNIFTKAEPPEPNEPYDTKRSTCQTDQQCGNKNVFDADDFKKNG